MLAIGAECAWSAVISNDLVEMKQASADTDAVLMRVYVVMVPTSQAIQAEQWKYHLISGNRQLVLVAVKLWLTRELVMVEFECNARLVLCRVLF